MGCGTSSLSDVSTAIDQPHPSVPGAASDAALKKGVPGALCDAASEPMRFVLTGAFPQFAAPGEPDLQMGKAAVTDVIKRFGGTVCSSMSGYVLA